MFLFGVSSSVSVLVLNGSSHFDSALEITTELWRGDFSHDVSVFAHSHKELSVM